MRSGAFVLCCLLSLHAAADVAHNNSLNDVYYRGAAETTGATTHTLYSDDYAAATAEQPLYLRVAFDTGATLAVTRVDFSSSDPLLSQPINLALTLSTNDPAYRMAAQPDAVQIVRWVAGEDAFWIRVRQSSSTWIEGPEGLQAPTETLSVSYTYGQWSYQVPGKPAGVLNLTGNSRDGSGELESTLICLDLRQSTLQADNTREALLDFYVTAYLADAETAPGVYVPGTEAGIRFYGEFTIARGKEHAYSVTQIDGAPSIPGLLADAAPDTWQDATGSFSFTLSTGYLVDGYLAGHMNPGSQLQLEVPAGLAMGIRGARFRGAPAGTFEAGEPTQGGTGYRTATLTWTGNSLRTQASDFTVEVDLSLPANTPIGDLALEWQWVIAHSNIAGIRYFHNSLDPCAGPLTLPRETQVVAHLESGPLLPHITRADGPFDSRVLLANPGTEPATLSLHCYNEAGTWLDHASFNLLAGETRSLGLGDELPADTAYIRTSAASPITASVVYTTKGDQKGPAQLPLTRTNSTRLRLYAGNQERTYDGLAMVNVSGETAQVTVLQYDADGGLHAAKEVADLAPGAKLLYVLNGNFEPLEGALYEVRTSRPIAMTAVRGDQQSQYLWQVEAVSVD